MRAFKTAISGALAFGLAMAASIAPALAGVEVKDVTVRAPIIEGRPGVAYFTIVNSGPAADRLLSIQSPVIGKIEIHQTLMEGNMMSMRQIPSLDIPAGGEVVFKSGAYHAMLFDMKAGQTAKLVFSFEKAGNITVEAKITPPGGHEHHNHMHMN